MNHVMYCEMTVLKDQEISGTTKYSNRIRGSLSHTIINSNSVKICIRIRNEIGDC